MKKILIFSILFLLTSCYTNIEQRGGKITDKGLLSETTIIGAENAKESANIDKKESEINFKHKDGDVLKIEGNNALPFSIHGDGLIGESGKMKIEYFPKEGAETEIKGIELKADGGNSYENKAQELKAILENSKMVQYVGIGIFITGIVFIIFKLYGQGGICIVTGSFMVILQSTLGNNIWIWIIPSILIIIPALWLFHLYKKNSLNKVIVSSIEEIKSKDPETGEKIKEILSKRMDKTHKKQIKTTIKSVNNN